MIISHKHRYVFIQLPRTACTAIARELIQQYDGQEILYKHAPYHRFLKIAKEKEKKYFVFSAIRNPIDRTVSAYFRIKSDHKGEYSAMMKRNNLGLRERYQLIQYKFIQKHNADFASYFLRFYKMPYDDWSSLAHSRFDYVIRFEKLQEDFAIVLKLLGIKQKRPIPIFNKTEAKKDDFMSYYTPDIVKRAKKVFGPFMDKWGYEFPAEWGKNRFSWWTLVQLHAVNLIRKPLWKLTMR